MAPLSPLQHMHPINGRSPDGTPRKPGMEPNVVNVVLGDLLIKPWYPSFYPEELIGRKTERLYVCQWCFKYSKELMPFLGHVNVCPHKNGAPPGTLIYSKDASTIYEVDGEEHKLYTQQLSLFAKLFLDTKSVFYDVTTFLYYLLVYTDPSSGQSQVVGFFSKEKMSWDNNNLACILVFPPWQKRGFGQVLMGISYELSKREGRLGGPEKRMSEYLPYVQDAECFLQNGEVQLTVLVITALSELGKRGYLAFWSGAIARYIVSRPSKRTVTVKMISEETYILPDDIITTLKEMDVLERRSKGGAEAAINKAKVRAWVAANGVSMIPPVNPAALVEYGEDMNGEITE